MLNKLFSQVPAALKWAHQTMGEIPILGQGYTAFNHYISLPVWKTACGVKRIAGSFFINYGWTPVRRYPILAASVVIASMVVVVTRAICRRNRGDDKPHHV